MRVGLFVLCAVAAVVTAACAASPSIQLADASRSRFEGAVYKGETAVVATPAPGVPAYRVFREGGTGFVSIQSVREDAESAAGAFCQQTGKAMRSIVDLRRSCFSRMVRMPIRISNTDRVNVKGKRSSIG